MIKRVVAFFLMAQLLLGSILLPAGDFSLLKELPRMYQAYEKVVSPDEKGVLDFVGDYLFGGKDLLGHNKHDRPDKTGTMQFQHITVLAFCIERPCPVIGWQVSREAPDSVITYLPGKPTDYHPTLFRPPLA